MIKISIIFPARNEEKLIKSSFESVYTYLRKTGYSFEVIVVANDCRDKTEEILNILFQKYSGLFSSLSLTWEQLLLYRFNRRYN